MLKPWWFVLLLSPFLPAQQPPVPQRPVESAADSIPAGTLKVRTELVLVPVVVRDKQGKHISGLTKDEFRLEENGQDQVVSLFEEVKAEIPDTVPTPNSRPWLLEPSLRQC